jgi:ABC-type transporter Mla subunit MlaD
MKDNEVREYINRLTSIARTYAEHQSLRERIAHEVLPLIETFRANETEWQALVTDYKKLVNEYSAEMRKLLAYVGETNVANARMRVALHEIAEEYAGYEGFEPQTAPEAYLQRVLNRVYTLAVDAQKNRCV